MEKEITEQAGQLIVPVGYNAYGSVIKDFSLLPSILFAGTTGSGKTAFVQTLMMNLMEKYSSKDISFLVFDSKRVDYSCFNGCPHLMIPVVHEPGKVCGMLNWMVAEAEFRLKNEMAKRPHLIAVLDDYSTAMDRNEVTTAMTRLTQLGRQVGMHIWIVTSTPSSNIIPTAVRANIFTRVAFHSVTRLISRIILDENGAELLTIPGEMIFKTGTKTDRCFAAHYSDSEIAERCETFRKKHMPVEVKAEDLQTEGNKGEDKDPFFWDAAKCIIEKDRASIGLLQRTFRIGFNRALRIMDQLEEVGVIEPEAGTKPRRVLINLSELEQLQENKGE